METIVIKSNSKKTTSLIQELSKQLKLKHKTFSKEEFEDLFLAKSIDEGLKSGYVSKEQVLKSLKK
jgi:hypothetical protein